MSDLTIITGIFGGYDTVKPHRQQTVDVRWVTVQDDPRYADLHPRTAAKRPKLFPWEYTTTECSVWIDGSFAIISPDFAAMVLDVLASTDLAMFRHPWRNCIYDEVNASRGMAKYQNLPMDEQVATYRAAGHPEHWGLWETGVIARRHTPVNLDLSCDWWDEIMRWTYQDQLSWPTVLRRHDVRPTELAGLRTQNPWLEWQGHLRED